MLKLVVHKGIAGPCSIVNVSRRCCIALKVLLFCELHASPSFPKMDLFPAYKYEGGEPSSMFGLLERTDFNHWIGHLFLPPVGRPCIQFESFRLWINLLAPEFYI